MKKVLKRNRVNIAYNEHELCFFLLKQKLFFVPF